MPVGPFSYSKDIPDFRNAHCLLILVKYATTARVDKGIG